MKEREERKGQHVWEKTWGPSSTHSHLCHCVHISGLTRGPSEKKIVNKTSTIQNHLGWWDNFVSYSGLMESRRTECPGGRYLLDESLFWRFGVLCWFDEESVFCPRGALWIANSSQEAPPAPYPQNPQGPQHHFAFTFQVAQILSCDDVQGVSLGTTLHIHSFSFAF